MADIFNKSSDGTVEAKEGGLTNGAISIAGPQQLQLLPTAEATKTTMAMDLVLGAWLSSSTLLEPKLVLATMLCNHHHCRYNGEQVPTPVKGVDTLPRQVGLRVEAFGSGVVIIPCFPFDDTTTTSEVFDAVRQHLQADTQRIRLRCNNPKTEICEDGLTLVGHGIAADALLSVIIVNEEQLLAKGSQITDFCLMCRFFCLCVRYVCCVPHSPSVDDGTRSQCIS